MSILEFENVSKVFRSSLTGRYMCTLGPLSFTVRQGEIFGYLGPNGAGKTTTIKIAMGLLRPSTGRVLCFGKPSTSIEARKRIGFLPEQPYFYQHLTAYELIEFYGDIFGLTRAEKRKRADELLEVAGLKDHRNTPLSKFSKGMLQRMGLAQALINHPDLVILDEPLTGLDPVGRREVRDLILRLKSEGKTIFFSSHILQDVEMICDRVAILSEGKILRVATLAEVLDGSIRCVEILVHDLPADRARQLGIGEVSRRGDKTVIAVPPGIDVNDTISRLIAFGAKILAVIPLRGSLEDYFMSEVKGPEYQRAAKVIQYGEAFEKVSMRK